ncbi:cutinase family protein [Spirillospora sp. CA-294931]|uniref:cutinase family protein n=1 Tax=Spirillospora sp. CA-294931 TaxID=3240042 RepID=UPI003D8F2604
MRALLAGVVVVSSVLVVSGSQAASEPVVAAEPVAATKRIECAPYLIIGLRGSGQGMSDPLGMSGTVGNYVQQTVAKLPQEPGQVKTYSLPYPANPVGLKTYPPSLRDGVWILRLALRRIISRCPGTNVGIVGYSQGAQVTDLTLRAIPEVERRVVRGVVLLSDPVNLGHTAHAITVTPGGQVVTRKGKGILGALTDPYPADMQARTFDFCIEGDPVCDAPDPLSAWDLIIAAFSVSLHGKYNECCGGQSYEAARILSSKLAERMKIPAPQPPALGPTPVPPDNVHLCHGALGLPSRAAPSSRPAPTVALADKNCAPAVS